MKHYVMMLKLTGQGIRSLDQVGDLMRAVTEDWGLLGGKAEAYAVMGEYDFIVHGTAKSDEDITWFAAQVAHSGLLAPQTMRAFTDAEMDAIFEHPPAEPLRIIRTLRE